MRVSWAVLCCSLLCSHAAAQEVDVASQTDDISQRYFYEPPRSDASAQDAVSSADVLSEDKQLVVGLGARPFHVIVEAGRRWNPAQPVRVAFLGGDDILRGKIERVAKSWTGPDGANLSLEFRDAQGAFLTWNRASASTADIRIAFDEKGYSSLVGTDSKSSGGLAKSSMSLARFDTAPLPANWEAIVLHEFGHAIGFQHEHQNPEGHCDFKFNDDPGYVWTRGGPQGEYWKDRHQPPRWPGLYTYFTNSPFRWNPADVDLNFGRLDDSQAYMTSAYDPASIMRYAFYPFMFKAGVASSCFRDWEAATLSPGDLEGARRAYPHQTNQIFNQFEWRRSALQSALTIEDLKPSTKALLQSNLDALSLDMATEANLTLQPDVE